MNTHSLTPTQTFIRPHPNAPFNRLDLSRGARQFGLRSLVFLDAAVRTDYAELDPALGHNVAGIVLAVLAFHEALPGLGRDEERITVCLVRRRDEQLVEVDLVLQRRRQRGGEAIELRRVAERELATPVFDPSGAR